ncbi:MAG: von Willebrand factor, type, partial [Mycobacterium sp.]|nr:von Willebrand factor, type [Mycobacterium sp.]
MERFRLLATHVAGRAVEVAVARVGEPAYTNGKTVFVSSDRPVEEQRREVLLQCALLRAGSLERRLVRPLRGRPSLARRYLAVEGSRALAELAGRSALAAALAVDVEVRSATPQDSLDVARGRAKIADPPAWFGTIRPVALTSSDAGPSARPTESDLRLHVADTNTPEDEAAEDEDEDDDAQESKILKLFAAPAFTSQGLSEFLRKLMGKSRSGADDAAGGELRSGATRKSSAAGPDARPLPTPIRFTDGDKPGAAIGIGGALHPEWDVHRKRYLADWCRVLHFPLRATAAGPGSGVPVDDVLRRRLSRVGLAPKVLRGRADGDDVDIEALTDFFVDLRSGHSPPEHVYLERRKIARNLGVLILLDASGSATDTDASGLTVHDHQRRAAGTLAATLEELGDRVAVYAFRSEGRHAVHLPTIKTFGQRFGAVGLARLDQLQASGYTRLGAAIRGAGEILRNDAGTPNRLLLVLSDGHPYDDGYEGRYAEADAHKALEELRADGLACLCLSVGAATGLEALERVFGSASFASAPTLADLSPRMDELFLSAL